MNAGMIGAVIGAIVGFFNYRALKAVGERVEKPETKKVLGVVALLDLVVFPVLGYFIGTYGFAA